ncbi:RecF/RecN/SMC protein [Peniophora sp. CONT]|nr:RecF/RecN/SMC protein [Peniophora sp. CONT]
MEFLTAKPRTPKKEKGKGKQKSKEDEQESFEEEISLLDTNGESPRKKAATPTPVVEKEPEGPRARLVIHKLVLVNFKSYAGRQEIGPFHKSFSAIVGPNGSGKSNTIDALLFVFGYRASKMRQAKLSELIHNSVHHPDLDNCSVEVHFREIIDEPGSESFEIVPNSTLVVTRTAYKNNSSDYTINRRTSTYKEVQTLLKGRGIDLDHNRFLILQGEVESIAQMKPKAPTKHEDGLLEYLEDIIGTAELKPAIDEALTKLEELQEERTHKLNRLRITEGQKNALEEEKAAALEHIRLKNELMRAKSFLYQFYLSSCFKQEVKLNEGKRGIEEKLKTMRAENEEELALHAELEADYNAKKAAFDEVEAAMAVTSKELEGNQQNEKALTQKHKDAEKRYKKLVKSRENDEKALEAAKAAIGENEETMATQTEKVHDLEAELVQEQENLEKVMDSLKDKTKHFQDQIETKQRELQPWAAKTNEAKRKVDVCSNERESLVQKASDAAKALAEAQEQFKKLQDAQVSKARLDEQKGLKTRRQGLQAEIADADRKHKELAAEVTRLSKEASHRTSRLEEARSNQSQGRSNNRVLDGLQTFAAAGRVSGFHGRLGGLGTIDSKYDVAITTACGSLNNMVCDTVEQATACMNHLRIQNIGRANFMVLEKINGEPRNEPAPLRRLYDLVKPREPRFAKVFWKALGDTLVADNIDEANSVAVGGRRRYRVVTLDGQLVDSSGTMSGGGNTVQRGGMNEKFAAQAVSAAEMGKLEKDHNAAAAQLQEAQSRLRAAEARVEALRHEGPQVDKSLQMLEVDVKDMANRLQDAEKRVNELGARSKPDAGDQKRIKELEREHAQLAASLEKLQEKTGAIEAEIDTLNEKVKAAGGSKLLMQRSKVDSIKQYIDIATQEVTKAEVGLDKARKDVKRLSAATGGHDEAIADAEAEVEEFMEALSKAHESVEEGEEALREASNQLEGIKEELHDVKDKFEETSKALREFRQREEKYKMRLADVEGKLKENTDLINNYERLHSGLSLEDIEEDDDEEEETAAPVADGEPSERPTVKPDPEGKTSSRTRAQGEKDERGFRLYTEPELAQQTQGALQANIQSLDEHLDKTKPNPAVLKRYREREEEAEVRVKELDDATAARDAQKAHYDALCKHRFDTFMKGFNEISNKLKEMYQMITLGGNAELELVDSMDPFSEGIIFSVMPPKKSWRNISNLSGGEKTLSSLALVFALHTYKPTPLYFMDEIDAALDFRNVSIVANYIKDRTKNAQFIIISLRNDMFELSQRLIGIYKTSNQTRSISIDNRNLHSFLPSSSQPNGSAAGGSYMNGSVAA